MDDGALCFRSVTELARLVRAGGASSAEVVESCLARIAEVNGAVNAVVALAPDALDRARAADEALARGQSVGPLHGVPFTAKDSLDTAGVATTAGTIGWRDRVPSRDATVVARLRAAGGILLGKTNTPEFTWSDETDNDVYGRTNNPYDLGRTPGGSSGGPAAIVAAAGSPLDIGSDTGDSIRQPSHVCGIAGIKPTSGRVPRTGHWPDYRGILGPLTQLGPMARRVDDLALVLPLIAGPDGEDPQVPPVPMPDLSRADVAGLQVVAFTDNGLRTPTPATVLAVEAAIDALADGGALVRREVPPGLGEAWRAWDALIRADGWAWLQRLISAAGTPGMGSYAAKRLADPRGSAPGRGADRAPRAGGRDPRRVPPLARGRGRGRDRVSGDAAGSDPPRREQRRLVRGHVQRRPQPHRAAGRGRPRRVDRRRPADRRPAAGAALARGPRARRGPRGGGGVGRLAAAPALRPARPA